MGFGCSRRELFGRSESSGLKPKESRAGNVGAEAPTRYEKRTRQDGASGTWVSEDVERTDSLRSFASLRMTGGTFKYEEWGGRDATRNQDCRYDRDKHLCWRTASEGGPYTGKRGK
jgi:hypothetical protein